MKNINSKLFQAKFENFKLAALSKITKLLFENYRLTWHQLDWWQDHAFNSFLKKFGEFDGFNTHRKWTLWQLIRLAESVQGDTAECGVYTGASSWLICVVNKSSKNNIRIHHLFDSFEGVSAPVKIDGTYWKKGDLTASEDLVMKNLSEFRSIVEVHKGWIPERFNDVSNTKFAFVHVDVDLYEPTKDSISFFYERLNPMGIFICDDYGFSSCPGATKAIDEFLADKMEKMISLPAGGGFFIKNCPSPVIVLSSENKE